MAPGESITAALKLNDPALLAKAFNECQNWEYRWVAIANIIDKALLGRIAREDKNEEVRQAASKRLEQFDSGEKK